MTRLQFHLLKQLVNSETATFFENSDVLAYLAENAEILHTQGKSYILSSIDEYLANHQQNC
ncbi:MAG: DUF3791 domain-containing protein [Spirochaetaceae bacterium]|nr:DUF3791 domain-containing protein [Spirochaetaceae bacterium]